MTNTNTQQVNMFSGGMDTDTSDMFIDKNRYRMAKNLRFVTDTQSSGGELHAVQGFKPVLKGLLPNVIATTVVRNLGVIVQKTPNDDESKWCVKTFDNNKPIQLKTVFLCKEEIGSDKPSVLGLYETNKICKLYIADGVHPLMIIDLLPKKEVVPVNIDEVAIYSSVVLNKPIINGFTSGSLKSGCVSYAYRLYGLYGPGTEMSIPTRQLQIPEKPVSGNSLKGAKSDYATGCGVSITCNLDDPVPDKFDHILIYRISYQVQGQLPLIELIYDGKRTGNSVKFIDSGQKALGTLTLEEYNNVSGNHIIPKIIESKNDYLFAGNIKEQQHDLFEDYDARAYSFNPRGIAYLYDASGVNRVNVTSSTYDTVKPTGDCFNKYNDMSTEPLDDRNNFIDEDGSYCRYDIDKYYGGTGVNISWRFVTASLVGDANVSVLATGQYGNDRLGTSSICIDKNTSRSIDVTKPVVCKYLKYRNDNSSEKAQYDTSEYVSVSSSLSYSDAKTSMLFRSLRRDELYRYGIVLYHKNGSASNVKWIADIRTPNITWNGCETFHARGSKKEDFAEDLIVKPLGIEFDVRNLPEDCVGYEIVRCQRKESDIATISQGVISRPIAEQYSPGLASRPTTAGSIVYTPSGFITTNRYWTGNDAYARVHSNADSSGWEADNFENNTIYQFISPEVSYLKGSMKDFDNNVSLSLNPVKYIFGASSTTLGDTYNQYKTSLTYEGKKYRGIYPSAGNGRFACGYDTFVQSDDGQSVVYKTLTRDKAKSNVLFPTLCCKNDGVDIVNSLYKFRSSFELSREGGYGSTEAGKDDVSTDSNGDHNQYTGVTPSRGNIYINSDGTLTRGVSFVMSYGNEGNVTDGGFQTVRDATYMYVKLYEQYSYVWSRVHNANHIGQAGYIKGDEAVGYVPVYRRINNGLKFAVKDSVIPKEFSWDDYASRVKDTANWTKSFNDKIDAIGNTNYCNYVSGGGFSQNIEAKDGDNFVRDCQLYGPGGSCMLLQIDPYDSYLDNVSYDKTVPNPETQILFDTFGTSGAVNSNTFSVPEGSEDLYTITGFSNSSEEEVSAVIKPESLIGTFLCNLRKNVIPYGGYSAVDRSLNTYCSYGNYFKKDDTNTKHVIFDGDCYIQPFEYVSMHKQANPEYLIMKTMMVVYAIPVETNINLAYTYGHELSRNLGDWKTTLSQIQPANVMNKYTQTTPMYQYNSAYSIDPTAKQYAAQSIEETSDTVDTRVVYAGPKQNGERIDSWSKFQASNYIDVDSKYGQLTQLRSFHNQLLFWQENAFGVLSVNERVQMTDDSNMPLILGTGGVLQRYDYVLTTNGMKADQYADTQSDSAVYWFDNDRRELCTYTQNGSAPLSKAKQVQNLMNASTLNNEPVVTYDKKFNEILFNVTDIGAVVYSELAQSFTGLYTIPMKTALSFQNDLYFTDDTMYKWNEDGGSLGHSLKYVVNDNSSYVKTFDNAEFGAKTNDECNNMKITFKTKVGTGTLTKDDITNREYSYRYAIPRAANAEYGDRMRDKTMSVEMTTDGDNNFSIQYIITKYRISWS